MSQSQIAQFQVKTVFNQVDAPDGLTAYGYADGSNPYIPSTDQNYVFRSDILREVIAFLKRPDGDALFLSGPTGSGKTSVITEIAGRLNWPVQQITANSRKELSDLVGFYKLTSPQPGMPPVMTFLYGPLSKAMREGHILLINEIDYMDPGELGGLNDVLEGRPLVIAENGGEIIKPHPMFRVIVTGNSTGSGDSTGLYQGVQMQNLATMDRYRFTMVDYAEESVELGILERVVPTLPEVTRKGIVQIANHIRKQFMGSDGSDAQLSVTMSTRTLVRWAKLTLAFRGAPNPLEYSLNHAFLNKAQPEEKVAIVQIAKGIFGDQWGTN